MSSAISKVLCDADVKSGKWLFVGDTKMDAKEAKDEVSSPLKVPVLKGPSLGNAMGFPISGSISVRLIQYATKTRTNALYLDNIGLRPSNDAQFSTYAGLYRRMRLDRIEIKMNLADPVQACFGPTASPETEMPTFCTAWDTVEYAPSSFTSLLDHSNSKVCCCNPGHTLFKTIIKKPATYDTATVVPQPYGTWVPSVNSISAGAFAITSNVAIARFTRVDLFVTYFVTFTNKL
jgi:hypothetical protein